ncbi:ABC transporter substrate-binding protein [Paenibacillus sepulcri]|uniref:ABC transporter substrate-binding protein n=1 Tax=Paenibacillus sepulcri TaxID=359917 RepID=A0ABS7C5X8_9BACL|nr:ABC transporter substrate-binding protein [Paenibacillus sepulcri]
MKTWQKFFMMAGIMALMGTLLAACGSGKNETEGSAGTASVQPEKEQQASADTAEEPASRSYTDSKGHSVEIPVHPQRIIYTGGEPGDLLALGVKPVGAALGVIKDQVAYPELLDGIGDVGDLMGNPEKIASLEPDLILMDAGGSYYEDGDYDLLAKIAPTVAYDRLSTNERLTVFGEILGKQQEAEEWISSYNAEVGKVTSAIGVKSGETATVLLQLGKELYVMGNSGFAATLYENFKFQPSARVKSDLIDKNERFAQISDEVMADFMGDRLYVLTDEDDAARAKADSFAASALWKSIPAVKNGQVFYVSTKWNFDDPETKKRLLTELPVIMKK